MPPARRAPRAAGRAALMLVLVLSGGALVLLAPPHSPPERPVLVRDAWGQRPGTSTPPPAPPATLVATPLPPRTPTAAPALSPKERRARQKARLLDMRKRQGPGEGLGTPVGDAGEAASPALALPASEHVAEEAGHPGEGSDAALPPGEAGVLRGLKVAFFGDSVLGDVYRPLVAMLVAGLDPSEYRLYGAWEGIGFAMDPKEFHQPGGHIGVRFVRTGGDYEMLWYPSAHQYRVDSLRPSAGFRHLAYAVVGIGTWDMGAYYKGIDLWAAALSRTAAELAAAVSGGAVGGAAGRDRVVLSGLHKLWTDKCADQAGPCVTCNSPGKEALFREVVGDVAGCASGQNGGYTFFDTLDITSTPAAQEDSAGTHFGAATNRLKARRLGRILTMSDAPPPAVCRDERHYDERLRSSGGHIAQCGAAGPGGDARVQLLCAKCRVDGKTSEARCKTLCAQR